MNKKLNLPLLTRYKTETDEFDICGLPIKLVRITNVDELFDDFMLKADKDEDYKDERIPYWADLWPSAIALSQHIVKTKLISPWMHVLEIGCGLALPAIVAGKFSEHITITDYMKEPLEFARFNWELNNSAKARFELLDWRNTTDNLAADVLLASDIAYESRAFPYLPGAFKLLTKRTGVILISEPDRSYAKDFFKSLPTKGFKMKNFRYVVNHNNLKTKVNVSEIRLL